MPGLYRSNLFSETWSRFTAQVYDMIMFGPENRHLHAIRGSLISKVSGQVLELGCGTGVNFSHYSSSCEVVAIDPSPHMLAKARSKLAKEHINANISIHPITIHQLKGLNLIPEDGYDAVVCTLVLCTVPDLEQVISKLKKLLKPCGKLIILEHVKSHKATRAWWQDRLTPAWKQVAEGCHLNRPTDKLLKSHGFYPIHENYYEGRVPFYEAILKIA